MAIEFNLDFKSLGEKVTEATIAALKSDQKQTEKNTKVKTTVELETKVTGVKSIDKLNEKLKETADNSEEATKAMEAIDKVQRNLHITYNKQGYSSSELDYLKSEEKIVERINKLVKDLKESVGTGILDSSIATKGTKTQKDKTSEIAKFINAGKAKGYSLDGIVDKSLVESIAKVREEFLLNPNNGSRGSFEKFTEKAFGELVEGLRVLESMEPKVTEELKYIGKQYESLAEVAKESAIEIEKANEKIGKSSPEVTTKGKTSTPASVDDSAKKFEEELAEAKKEQILTGKEEHYRKSVLKIEKDLKCQPAYISGFYYFMRNSGKTSSYKTHEMYLSYVIKFFKEINKEPEEVTMDDITMYLAELSVKEDGSSTSGSYLVAVHSALKKFFEYMMSNKGITENPMEHIERPDPKKSELVERSYLNKKEIKKLFKLLDEDNTCWSLQNKVIFILLFGTGVRRTCLTEINVSNIDFENNCIYVLDKGTKPNVYYLSKSKMDTIAKWIEARNELLKGRNETEALFISNRFQRISQKTVYRLVQNYTAKIGHEISPQDTRTSFAINALDSGVNLQNLSKLMNISLVQATEIYKLYEKNRDIKESALKATDYLDFED